MLALSSAVIVCVERKWNRNLESEKNAECLPWMLGKGRVLRVRSAIVPSLGCFMMLRDGTQINSVVKKEIITALTARWVASDGLEVHQV